MSWMTKDLLILNIKKYKRIFVVKDDFTYDVRSGSELNKDAELGVMGFALTNGRGVGWLRIGDNAYAVDNIDVSNEYAHLSLSKRKGIKLGRIDGGESY